MADGDEKMTKKIKHRLLKLLTFLLPVITIFIIWIATIGCLNTYKMTISKNWIKPQFEALKQASKKSEEWLYKRTKDEGSTIALAEDEVLDTFIMPINVSKNGSVYFFNKEYVIYDKNSASGLPEGKSFIDVIMRIDKDGSNSNILDIGSGVSWQYVLDSENDKQYLLWTSFEIDENAWTIGISVPEKEILKSAGYYETRKIIILLALFSTCIVALILVIIFILLLKKDKYLIELEKTVEDRTAQLEALNRELIEEIGKVKHLSIHDSLTGVYNRTYFEEHLKRIDKPEYLPISIVSGDVNGLKLINDAFGHEAGDELLIDICNTIKRSCDMRDFVARIGGDEFVVVMINTTEEEAEKRVKKIKAGCNSFIDNLFIKSISLGVGTKVSMSRDIHDVYKYAEDKMYRNKLSEGKNIKTSIISALKKTLQERTYETEAHRMRLKKNVRKIGEALSLSNNEIYELELLAILHDVGKLSVNEEILKADRDLNEDEEKKMRKHVETGYRIASAASELSSIADSILHHHERWDGNGYPQKLKGKEIPLYSRIFAVANAFDVMVYGKNRYSKAKFTKEEAVNNIKRDAGVIYDPEIVDIFIDILNKDETTEKKK